MSTIAQGSSQTFTISPGSYVSFASNGGLFLTVETPVGGPAVTKLRGPDPTRKTFGPYVQGGTVVVTNQTVDNLAYVDYELGGGGGTGTVKTVSGKSPDAAGNVNIQRSDLTDDASLEATLATIPTNPLQIGATPLASGSWNASTNTPTITSGTAPTDGVYARTVTVAGTTTVDGNSTWNVNDIIEWKGGAWGREAANPITSNLVKGDNAGGLIPAVPGVDYRLPPLLQIGMALFLPPSGSTVGANGAALTLATALDAVYASCYMKFNANEIASGQASGWFYVEMSSTTAGIVYNNTYTPGSGIPAVPGSKTAFTTNAGSTTAGTTAIQTALQATISADLMGANGKVRYSAFGRWNNSAGNKQLTGYFGGNPISFNIMAGSTSAGASDVLVLSNAGVKGKQVAFLEKNAAGSASLSTLAIDTTQTQTVNISLKTSVATDWVGIAMGAIEVVPAA